MPAPIPVPAEVGRPRPSPPREWVVVEREGAGGYMVLDALTKGDEEMWVADTGGRKEPPPKAVVLPLPTPTTPLPPSPLPLTVPATAVVAVLLAYGSPKTALASKLSRSNNKLIPPSPTICCTLADTSKKLVGAPFKS